MDDEAFLVQRMILILQRSFEGHIGYSSSAMVWRAHS
jgi:hypothetical protein